MFEKGNLFKYIFEKGNFFKYIFEKGNSHHTNEAYLAYIAEHPAAYPIVRNE